MHGHLSSHKEVKHMYLLLFLISRNHILETLNLKKDQTTQNQATKYGQILLIS